MYFTGTRYLNKTNPVEVNAIKISNTHDELCIYSVLTVKDVVKTTSPSRKSPLSIVTESVWLNAAAGLSLCSDVFEGDQVYDDEPKDFDSRCY